MTTYRLGTYRDQMLVFGTTVITTAVNHPVLTLPAGSGYQGLVAHDNSFDERERSKWYKCTAATTASLFYWARVSSYPSALERSSWHSECVARAVCPEAPRVRARACLGVRSSGRKKTWRTKRKESKRGRSC